MTNKVFKSGFITLIGRPNVGKSTLMNHILGQKVAIISDKAQTTRNRIQGIYTDDEAQMIFIDTPGIHKPKHALGSFMVKTAFSSLQGADIVCVVVNADEKMGPGDRLVIERTANVECPRYLIINKIDLVTPEELLEVITTFTQEHDFDHVFPISALEGINVQPLLKQLKADLPEGPKYYPSDQIMDHPEYFLVAEFIREKILLLTHEEIPHSVAVNVEAMKVNSDDKLEIHAIIIVERDSQKGIIIGKQGTMIKRIGTMARRDIERVLGNKVRLELWVRVQKNWRERQSQLHDLGYQPDNY